MSIINYFLKNIYCVQIRSLSGPQFPVFGLKKDQKNSVFGQFYAVIMKLGHMFQSMVTQMHFVSSIPYNSKCWKRNTNWKIKQTRNENCSQ